MTEQSKKALRKISSYKTKFSRKVKDQSYKFSQNTFSISREKKKKKKKHNWLDLIDLGPVKHGYLRIHKASIKF